MSNVIDINFRLANQTQPDEYTAFPAYEPSEDFMIMDYSMAIALAKETATIERAQGEVSGIKIFKMLTFIENAMRGVYNAVLEGSRLSVRHFNDAPDEYLVTLLCMSSDLIARAYKEQNVDAINSAREHGFRIDIALIAITEEQIPRDEDPIRYNDLDILLAEETQWTDRKIKKVVENIADIIDVCGGYTEIVNDNDSKYSYYTAYVKYSHREAYVITAQFGCEIKLKTNGTEDEQKTV